MYGVVFDAVHEPGTNVSTGRDLRAGVDEFGRDPPVSSAGRPAGVPSSAGIAIIVSHTWRRGRSGRRGCQTVPSGRQRQLPGFAPQVPCVPAPTCVEWVDQDSPQLAFEDDRCSSCPMLIENSPTV